MTRDRRPGRGRPGARAAWAGPAKAGVTFLSSPLILAVPSHCSEPTINGRKIKSEQAFYSELDSHGHNLACEVSWLGLRIDQSKCLSKYGGLQTAKNYRSAHSRNMKYVDTEPVFWVSEQLKRIVDVFAVPAWLASVGAVLCGISAVIRTFRGT